MDGLEKFREYSPTYIEALEIIEKHKEVTRHLLNDIFTVLYKYNAQEEIYNEIGELFDQYDTGNINTEVPNFERQEEE